jgi:2-dehydro-3-deoxygluconokinase
MPELIAFGETMAAFTPQESAPLRYVGNFRLRIAGTESNTAIGVRKLGHSAGWISRVGDDELGRFVVNAIRAEGVDTEGVRVDVGLQTGLMIKETCGAGETRVYYYRANSAFAGYLPEMLPLSYLQDAKVCYLTGITPVLGTGCRDAVFEMAARARDAGVLVAFDPNIRYKLWGGQDHSPMIRELLCKADIALLGIGEAKTLFGTQSPEEICGILLEAGVRYIALKDGAAGAYIADEHKTYLHIPPYPCQSIDPIGAGDAFNAGFLAGILEGRPLVECGKMGAICGALVTQTTGDVEGQPTKEEISRLMQNQDTVAR